MRKSTDSVLIVDSAERNADLRYALEFVTPDPVVFLRHGGQDHLVVSTLEYGRAVKLDRPLDVQRPDTLKLPKSERRRISGWALGVLRRAGVRSVTVSPWFPHGIAARLTRCGVKVNVAAAALFPGRERKRPDEVEKIAEAQRAAVAATREAIAMIRAARIGARGALSLDGRPLTSERVRAQIQRTLLDCNCQAKEIIVAGGLQAADPHEKGHGPLRAGEAIVLDIFPQHQESGYWGDITRTVVRGAPSKRLRDMYRAVRAAQQLALDRVKPGVRAGAIHEAVVAEFARRGYAPTQMDGKPAGFIHGTGHGVGLEIHEAPNVSGDTRLRPGHVVTIEPGLYYPDLGGIRIEDTVVVTKGGHRILATFPKTFAV